MFFHVHEALGIAIRGGATSFHFNEDDNPVFVCNDVGLEFSQPPIGIENSIPMLAEIVLRQLFSQFTVFIVYCHAIR